MQLGSQVAGVKHHKHHWPRGIQLQHRKKRKEELRRQQDSLQHVSGTETVRLKASICFLQSLPAEGVTPHHDSSSQHKQACSAVSTLNQPTNTPTNKASVQCPEPSW